MPRPKGFGKKSAFIRSQPSDMRAKDVVAAAANEGIKITEARVYKVRSADKSNSAVRGKKGVSGRPHQAARNGAPKADRGLSGSDAELLQAIAAIGLSRARELFAKAEAAFLALR